MRIDKHKYRLACARACMNSKEVAAAAKIPRATLTTCMQRCSGSPATIGKIARALGADVLDIIEQEEGQ